MSAFSKDHDRDMADPAYRDEFRRQALEAAVPILERAARHTDVEDCWYSCAVLTCDDSRSGACDCGADEAERVLALVRKALA